MSSLTLVSVFADGKKCGRFGIKHAELPKTIKEVLVTVAKLHQDARKTATPLNLVTLTTIGEDGKPEMDNFFALDGISANLLLPNETLAAVASSSAGIYTPAAVRLPTLSELATLSDQLFYNIKEEELVEYQTAFAGFLDSYAVIDKLAETMTKEEKENSTLSHHKYPRDAGYRPTEAENDYNAWSWKCTIKGASDPNLPLAGKTLAIKDNVCIAGLPLMNGTRVLEGYVANEDATIVSRILDNGGTILGKSYCEDFCFSGASFSTCRGPIRNPVNEAHHCGGSSGGSGALVAGGQVDMAIACDQGGSIRIPACFCGVVGIKPTFGLVPYTGIFPIELTIDHCGPIAKTVKDAALLLEVLAGKDGDLDPRQPSSLSPSYTSKFTSNLSEKIDGLKVGVVTEGFGACSEEIQKTVKAAALQLRDAGAIVDDISIPYHKLGQAIWTGVAAEGAYMTMIDGNSHGTNWKGKYVSSLMEFVGNALPVKSHLTSPSLKVTIMLGKMLHEKYNGTFYAKAQNLVRKLTAEYDAALSKYDVLLMPTLPNVACELPKQDLSVLEFIGKALDMICNTTPFDVTGHPALTIRAGKTELPIGMMLIGKHFDEETIIRVAYAYECLRGD